MVAWPGTLARAALAILRNAPRCVIISVRHGAAEPLRRVVCLPFRRADIVTICQSAMAFFMQMLRATSIWGPTCSRKGPVTANGKKERSSALPLKLGAWQTDDLSLNQSTCLFLLTAQRFKGCRNERFGRRGFMASPYFIRGRSADQRSLCRDGCRLWVSLCAAHRIPFVPCRSFRVTPLPKRPPAGPAHGLSSSSFVFYRHPERNARLPEKPRLASRAIELFFCFLQASSYRAHGKGWRLVYMPLHLFHVIQAFEEDLSLPFLFQVYV